MIYVTGLLTLSSLDNQWRKGTTQWREVCILEVMTYPLELLVSPCWLLREAGQMDSFSLQLCVVDMGSHFRQRTDRHVTLICLLLFFMIKMITYHESFKVTWITLLFSLSDLLHLIIVDSFIRRNQKVMLRSNTVYFKI